MNVVSAQSDFVTAHEVRVVLPGSRVERVFGLHPALHIGVYGGFFLYLGILWSAFGEPGLVIPFAIFFIFLSAAFVVPALWARVAPNDGAKTNWQQFLAGGFECATGHLDAGAVIAQVMLMPVMLVVWGLAVAITRWSVRSSDPGGQTGRIGDRDAMGAVARDQAVAFQGG